MVKFEFLFPCKDYVAHYLKINFGDPVYLRSDSVIGKYFFSLVEDASQERDKEFRPQGKEVKILITESLFLRKGCVLTKTNITRFNCFLEDYFKTQVNLVLDSLVEANDVPIKKAIDYVYDRFEMNEIIFPLETIVKQYYRERKRREGLINLR